MRHPNFARGWADIRAGRAFDPDIYDDYWAYERGRLLGAIAPLAMQLSDLQAALRRKVADIIAIGSLLLEAQEQLEHGEWLPWLKLNFGASIRSAQNYMSAARCAAKYATVAHLKLTPSMLYWLGGDLEATPLDEINAILKAAETEWVDLERAGEILNLLHAERRGDHDDAAERDEAAAERTEADDILDGPPPGVPPAPDPTPIDLTLRSFDEAVRILFRLHTKPLDSFAATTHGPEVISTVHEFMGRWRSFLKSNNR